MDKYNDSQISIKNLLVVYYIFFFFIVVSSIITLSLSVFVIQVLCATVTFFLIRKKSYNVIKLYMIIYVVSVLSIFIVYMAYNSCYGVPYFIGGSDDLNFERWGYDVYSSNMFNPAEIIKYGVLDEFHNSPFFAVYISIFIRIANVFDGYNTFIPRFANIYFLIWSCFIIEYLLKKYTEFDNKRIYFTIAIFALIPNIQFINAHVFRDTFNLFQVLFTAYIAEQIFLCRFKIRNILYVFLLIFMMYANYYTRKNSIILSIMLVLLMIYKKTRHKKAYVMLGFLVLIVFGTSILKILNVEKFVETYAEYIVNINSDGMSKLIFTQDLFPMGIILRALYGFIIPFPNIFLLFKSPEMLLYDIVYLLIYLGVIIQIIFIPFILKRIMKFDFISIIFLIYYLGVITTTFTFRHVILYYPFMVALAVDEYLSSTKAKRERYLSISLSAGVILGFVYVVLKKFS